MAFITLQVLDGADRGVVYEDLATPLTIGREEGNAVQLNDERISRFHIKIQEDRDRIVLTDLESTNGTRVNGQATQLRILRFDGMKEGGVHVPDGAALDQLTGPSAATLDGSEDDASASRDSLASIDPDESVSIELDWSDSAQFPSALHLPGPPDVPEGLSPAQAAQVSEMLEYFHLRCRSLVADVKLDDSTDAIPLERTRWQELLDLQSLLAQYLRILGEGG